MKNKKCIYKPAHCLNDRDVVVEFASVMPELEKAHRCPVRLVKTKGLFGFRYAIYELLEINIKTTLDTEEIKKILKEYENKER